LESDGIVKEPFYVVEPSFDGEHDDAIENIDDFLCIGRHGWDMIYFPFDGNLIYDINDGSKIKNA